MEGRFRSAAVLDLGWRVILVAVVNLAFVLLLGSSGGARASAQAVVLDLAQGALSVAVLAPLARRLPYRWPVRVAALFVPLYWIAYLSNLVEAWFDTTIAHRQLVEGAIFLVVPVLLISFLVAWLFPAAPREDPVPGILASLGERSLPSWVWRVAVVALLYAVLLQLFGTMYGPLIARYYHDAAFMAQSHTVPPPSYIAWPEEFARGVGFALALLPFLAVVRGRDWPRIAWAAAYFVLIGFALEAWQVVAMTSYPVGFRVGEGLDLTTDAVARGILVAALLVLPAARVRRPAEAVALA